MKKVLFDLSLFRDKPNCSMDIYTLRLLDSMSELKFGYKIILLTTEVGYSYLSILYPNFEFLILPDVINKSRIQRLLKFSTIKIIRNWICTINESNVDLLFCPYTDITKIWKINPPRLQVIHDIHGRYVTYGVEKLKHIFLTPILLSQSNYIIAITNFVKNDVLRKFRYLIKENSVFCVYNSVVFSLNHSSYSLKNENFILCVNAVRKYKNIITLVRAFASLKDEIKHNLVIVGRKTDYWDNVIYPCILKEGIDERVELKEYVSEDELNFLYEKAALFVTSSLYEGFGYTPIEAALHKIPVISTNESSLFEVTQGKVFYYAPPTNEVSLSSMILRVLKNPPSKDTLEKLSNEFQQKYSPIQQAASIDEIIIKCLNLKNE